MSSSLNASGIAKHLAWVNWNEVLSSSVAAEKSSALQNRAEKTISQLLDLPSTQQRIALEKKPELSKVKSMLEEGASLEWILNAVRISQDPSIVFPVTIETPTSQGGGGWMLPVKNQPSGNGGGGGGSYRD
jgi:hypothetical protein